MSVQSYAANVKWSRVTDASAATAPARRKFEQSFYDATPPDIPEKDRQRMAAAARRAHYQKLAMQSAKVRRANRDARRTATGTTGAA